MRRARVLMNEKPAGILEEQDGGTCRFLYDDDYKGASISLTMPTSRRVYEFPSFPPFFDGLLPEGVQLDALLKMHKIDRHDCFSQIVIVGADLVGAVTVREIK